MTDNSLTPSEVPETVHVLRDKGVLKRLRGGDATGLEGMMNLLVAVKLKIEGKGKLGQNTIICIPSSQDLTGTSIFSILENIFTKVFNRRRHRPKDSEFCSAPHYLL